MTALNWILCCHGGTWFYLHLTLSQTLSKPMCFSHGNVFLSYVNELCIYLEICLSWRLLSIVLWLGMTHLVLMLSPNACCGWGACCNSLSFKLSHFNVWQNSLQKKKKKILKKKKAHTQKKISLGKAFLSLTC